MKLLAMGISYLSFMVLHFLLLVLALVVAGLYGIELQRADEADKHGDNRWIYAEVVAGLSALTAILLMVPFMLRFMVVWVWDFVLFVLWVALFGVFGKMYIHEDPEGNDAIERMKSAVWVDLANAIGWLVAALASFGYWWSHRERRSRFTGRAKV